MPILSSHIHDKPWDNRRTQGTADMNTLLKSWFAPKLKLSSSLL